MSVDEKTLLKLEEIKQTAYFDTIQYFKEISDSNKKIDHAKIKHFLFKVSNHGLNPSDDDIDYIIKYYSEENSLLDLNQFQALVETILIDKFLNKDNIKEIKESNDKIK